MLMPTPSGRIVVTDSQIVAAIPIRSRQSAVVRPPMPAPLTRTRGPGEAVLGIEEGFKGTEKV